MQFEINYSSNQIVHFPWHLCIQNEGLFLSLLSKSKRVSQIWKKEARPTSNFSLVISWRTRLQILGTAVERVFFHRRALLRVYIWHQNHFAQQKIVKPWMGKNESSTFAIKKSERGLTEMSFCTAQTKKNLQSDLVFFTDFTNFFISICQSILCCSCRV